MKLRAPEGCGGLSHQGQILELAGDGSLEVDEEAGAVLAAHGFKPWGSKNDPGAATTISGAPSAPPQIVTLKSLLAIIAENAGADAAVAGSPPSVQGGQLISAASEPMDGEVEAISTLNRQGLFAFLRSRGASVSLPVTNEELRAAARRAIAP
jgi:hypothetical protein